MEILLLGPVEVRAGAVSVPVGGPKVRTLLAALALQAGRVVPVERLIDAVWGEQPPARARALIHTYVSTLRRVFAARTVGTGQQMITRHAPGYVLKMRAQHVDLHVFEQRLAQGRREFAEGHHAEAAEHLAAATSLWRGDALGGAEGRWADVERTRLDQLRLDALEERFEAELALDRYATLVEELSPLVAQHPLRERLRGQLMRALYAVGRQTDALACFQQGRRVLVDEIGIEPGPELRELHRILLSNAPAVTYSPRSSAPPLTRPSPVPRQLPGATRHFVGRTSELEALTGLLDEATQNPNEMVISTIGGAGGIGKTTLALHWAHQHLDRFPDGQLFVNLRGFDPSGEPVAVGVRGFLDALGVTPSAIPAELDAQVGLYRSLVAGRRMLIVLDNARDATQVRPLLPGSPTCTVIVTSRDRLAGLVFEHGARPLALDVLDETEARGLLGRSLGVERLSAEPEAVAELLAGCGGLPLALGIVAGRAALQPRMPLSVLAAELRDAATRLGALDDGHPAASVRAVLSWSYAALVPEQAEVFGLLGLAPGPDIGLPAAAALTDLPAARVGVVLRALERVSLVQQHTAGRYRMHDLIRLYAAEQAQCDQPQEHRDAALRRLVDFYLHTARAGDRLLDSYREPIEFSPPAPGSHPIPLHDHTAALAWLDAEHPCLLATQHLAIDRGWHSAVWQLAFTLDTFHYRRGHLHDHLAAWRTGLAAAEQSGDPTTQAVVHRLLGQVCARVGRHAEAIDHLQQALTLAEDTGDLHGQSYSHFLLAVAWEQRGDDERALEHATRSLHLMPIDDEPVWKAASLNAVGSSYARLGEHQQARVHCEAALGVFRYYQHREGEASTLDNLGYIAHQTGQHMQALDYYQQALAQFRDLGNSYEEANTLHHIGQTHAALGRQDHARRAWDHALELYRAQRRTTDADRVQQHLATLDQYVNATER